MPKCVSDLQSLTKSVVIETPLKRDIGLEFPFVLLYVNTTGSQSDRKGQILVKSPESVFRQKES